MAVWMQVFGEKKFENILQTLEICEKILPSVQLDFSFLGRTVQKYNPLCWDFSVQKNAQGQEYVCAIYWLFEEKEVESHQIRLYFFHDMVEFLGPFEDFQAWNILGEYENLEQGYRKIVRDLFRSLRVPEAIYCSERYFSNEELEYSFQDLKGLLAEHPDLEAPSLKGILESEYFRDKFE